ncbi:hypothetical protein N865_15635, partial [Intrasporangium oryzae NRRL B-24470]
MRDDGLGRVWVGPHRTGGCLMATNDTNSDVTTDTDDVLAPAGSAEASAEAPVEAPAPAAAAPRKRASRRVTKKAAAPRASAPIDTAYAAPPPGDEGSGGHAAEDSAQPGPDAGAEATA